jgi:uncharacterized protein (UPF0332 family)
MSEQAIIDYWLRKAGEDLMSAQENFQAGRLLNAVRDCYFACFHAFSSVLFKSGRTFRKHREVRSILHREYVRQNKIDPLWGKHYDWLFDNRQKADYRPLVEFDPAQVKEIIEQSKAFVEEMKRLLNP